ncbi:hypothetical protein ACKZDW_25360 [Ralstonia syzygii subsp. celebesensis]
MKYSASIRLNALGAIASQHGVLVVIGMLLFVPMAFPLLPIAATYCAAILAILLPSGGCSMCLPPVRRSPLRGC